MRGRLSLLALLAAAATVATANPVAGRAETNSALAGRLVAQRHCATCHAIADGESPLPDAPPFAHLHDRYGPGGLSELLAEGMIKDWPSALEEGSRPLHPRMPAVKLSADELAALIDYLESFPSDRPKGHRPKRR